MRKVFFLMGFCIISSYVYAQHTRKDNYYDNQKTQLKETYWVLTKSPEILDSSYISYFQNGNLKAQGQFKNNKVQGNWKYYYENGKTRMEGPYVEGKQDGVWKAYYENGRLNNEGAWQNEARTGEWNYYYENGTLKSTGNYIKNKKDGLWKYYHEDGVIKAQAIYDNDKGRYTEMFTNGHTKSQGMIVNGKSNGIWSYYHDNDTLQAKGEEKDGLKEGYWKFYHPNGKLASEGNYNKGVKEGRWKYYHENGQLSSEGDQKDGQKEGFWKLYYSNGTFKGEGNYTNGSGPYKEYYESGKLKIEGYMENDKYHGEWKYYYENGTLEGKCTYVHGIGFYKGYYEDGDLKMEGRIVNGAKDSIWVLYNPDGSIAGYYKTHYEEEVPSFPSLEKKQPQPNTSDPQGPTTKILRFRKTNTYLKKHFTTKPNEFQGIIISASPPALFRRQVPISFEYYFQERLGYEFCYTLLRSPMFVSDSKVPLDIDYRRGFSAHMRIKFYEKDHDRGMFYLAPEIRYTRLSHYVNMIDSTLGVNPFTIEKSENTIAFSVIVGDRFIKDKKKPGFTMDIFAGIGIGYRSVRNTWVGHTEYNDKFEGINENRIAIPFRIGVNLGYIFRNRINY